MPDAQVASDTLIFSVVVPVGRGDAAWQRLASELKVLPESSEVIFVGPRSGTAEAKACLAELAAHVSVTWGEDESGRAGQMNRGARLARGRFVWFLHADSELAADVLPALMTAVVERPRDLHYFDLSFAADGPWLTRLNGWGARFRSRVFNMPFGDQGLCIASALWRELGGFPEGLTYGEDHVFVWRAMQHGLRVSPVGATIQTSARKYRRGGWLKTTMTHGYLTWRQALPEIITLIKLKLRKSP